MHVTNHVITNSRFTPYEKSRSNRNWHHRGHGVGREAVWGALAEGRSGISRIEDFDTSNLKTSIAGVCRDFKPEEFFDERELSRLDRVSQLAIVATGYGYARIGVDQRAA